MDVEDYTRLGKEKLSHFRKVGPDIWRKKPVMVHKNNQKLPNNGSNV